MISSLKGVINRVTLDGCEIEVGGVGYWVYISHEFGKNHKIGDEMRLSIHMAVTENDISLFGFEESKDIEMFKMLVSVSGVGPKTAARIVWEGETNKIKEAIASAEVKFFESIKGIGKKTAQRIIIDLKSKIGGLGEINLAENEVDKGSDLFLGLKQLGFEKKEIEGVIRKLPEGLERTEDKLSWCLKNLSG